MPSIPFTQYLRPYGHKRAVKIDRPENVVLKAAEIAAAGYQFEIEELSTGHVSMTITGWNPETDEEGDVAQRICPNGPKVPEKVDEMILGFEIPVRPKT